VGTFFDDFPLCNDSTAPAIERHSRPEYCRAQAAIHAKIAPKLYSFPLALVLRALADDSAESLLALMAAFKAKRVVLPTPVAAYEYAPFMPCLF